ncbi:MAG: tyrosine--tRNA ligase, partial [Tetragenococcus koreensis]|nr:tyrosine--tRNA ligase [Tetragenococcus koreensis]
SFNVNTMLSKEAVASRLESGILFTEFSYQILQSIDFYHLLKEKDIQLQIGGADQWGNLANGVDLIHKKDSKAEAYGLTIPLMLKADGTKFGKTAGGAVWLDPKKTSPFEFYQFWFNQDDRDVVKYLKYFTFLSHDEINSLEEKVTTEPEKREAQKRLAQEVTSFVHGDAEMKEAEKISEVLFNGDIKQLSATEIKQAFDKVPSAHAENATTNIVELLVNTEIESSKRQAREDVSNGAITVNGDKVTDVETSIDPADEFDGKYIVVRKGKKNYTLISVGDAVSED